MSRKAEQGIPEKNLYSRQRIKMIAMAFDDDILLDEFSGEEGLDESSEEEGFLRKFHISWERFVTTINQRVFSEPPKGKITPEEKIKRFFQEEFCDITCDLPEKDQKMLYKEFRGIYSQLARDWRFVNTKKNTD